MVQFFHSSMSKKFQHIYLENIWKLFPEFFSQPVNSYSDLVHGMSWHQSYFMLLQFCIYLLLKYIALPLTSNNHLNNILAIYKSQTCKPWIATESELYNKNGTGLVNNLVSHQPNLIPTKHFQSTIHLIWPKVHKVIFFRENIWW